MNVFLLSSIGSFRVIFHLNKFLDVLCVRFSTDMTVSFRVVLLLLNPEDLLSGFLYQFYLKDLNLTELV